MLVSKYNASGNDFVIFHTFKEADYASLARKLCHRQKGIGADGLIVLVPCVGVDFKWLFYNSDGSEANMCGNGTRACAHYAYTNQLAKETMTFFTGAGKITSFVDGNIVETQMPEVKKMRESFEQEGRIWHMYDTGVPHLVSLVEDLNEYDKALASKMRYEHNANVNFVLYDGKALHVRTYERGVEDETGACGTGMAACFFALHQLGIIPDSIKVYPTSKEEVSFRLEKGILFFKGEVLKVFEAGIDI